MQTRTRPYGQSVLTQLQSLQINGDLKRRLIALSFTALWFLILIVAVVDGYFILINRVVLLRTELNPVGRFLLALDHGNIRYFFVAKCCGTIGAGSVLLVLYWTRLRIGFAVTLGVALFQLGLLHFLLFGGPPIDGLEIHPGAEWGTLTTIQKTTDRAH